ncbi:MAG: hypothetical protein UX82_C0001G0100 [Microgenomates group bacterium GW2011_GWE1_47_12]|nr:MAG: hypothetical protein UX82_C0001G0100 [Microgenomates group bacterium GW2011_GWE1_47_12]
MAKRTTILVSKSFYQMGVVTLAASVVWIIISIVLSWKKPSDLKIDPAILEPVNPKIDKAVIEDLQSREALPEIDWASILTQPDLVASESGGTE